MPQDAGANGVPCTAPVPGAMAHDMGNYDYESCNTPACHGSSPLFGGWLYANPIGPPWIGSATITISNIDGTTVTANSAADGFFQIIGEVTNPYKVCVSECPGTNCSLTAHPHTDCQTSNCHSAPNQRIYVSQNTGGTSGTGGASSAGNHSGNCASPVYGGPYMHSAPVFGQNSCSQSACHCPPNMPQLYQGGFLYDGPASTNTVAEATVTLVPRSGAPITAITGPDGLFFIGTLGTPPVPQALVAPYTACVSKCPLTVCSITNGHTTTSDCQTSNCHVSPMNVYLR